MGELEGLGVGWNRRKGHSQMGRPLIAETPGVYARDRRGQERVPGSPTCSSQAPVGLDSVFNDPGAALSLPLTDVSSDPRMSLSKLHVASTLSCWPPQALGKERHSRAAES